MFHRPRVQPVVNYLQHSTLSRGRPLRDSPASVQPRPRLAYVRGCASKYNYMAVPVYAPRKYVLSASWRASFFTKGNLYLVVSSIVVTPFLLSCGVGVLAFPLLRRTTCSNLLAPLLTCLLPLCPPLVFIDVGCNVCQTSSHFAKCHLEWSNPRLTP